MGILVIRLGSKSFLGRGRGADWWFWEVQFDLWRRGAGRDHSGWLDGISTGQSLPSTPTVVLGLLCAWRAPLSRARPWPLTPGTEAVEASIDEGR